MKPPLLLLLAAVSILFLSCKNESRYPYAIKDFRKSLQPHLTRMVTTGIVTWDSTFDKLVTDRELIKLFNAEHPILRAAAFNEAMDRESFNDFDLLMNHLYDTAIVDIDGGEFGIWRRMVSDEIINDAKWVNQESKDKTIDLVLTKHNYLKSAYTVLPQIKPQEKYYAIIKEMAMRPRQMEDGYELGFNDVEYALYGLASFKKKEDVKIIKDRLMGDIWRLSDISFRLLQDFPDTAYSDVFEDFHRRHFYDLNVCVSNDFTGTNFFGGEPENFTKALIVQKTAASARIIETMLNKLPQQTCMAETENLIDLLVMGVWDHPCPEYAALRRKVKKRVETILSREVVVLPIWNCERKFSNMEEVRWFLPVLN